jgi:hypothetical protein
MKGKLDLDILLKAIFTVYFVQMWRFETESTLQMADYACKMSHVFNNSLSGTIHAFYFTVMSRIYTNLNVSRLTDC